MKQKQEKNVTIKVIDRKVYGKKESSSQMPFSDSTVFITTTVTYLTGS